MHEVNPYGRFLDSRPVENILASTPQALAELVDIIGPDHIDIAPAEGKWSPAEILCHLADCEIAFGFRLRQTLAEDKHVIQPFDQTKWGAYYPGVPAQNALAAFTAMREWNLILIRTAMPAAAQKPVTHPERGTMTFTILLETMAGHDVNHTLQLHRIAKQENLNFDAQ